MINLSLDHNQSFRKCYLNFIELSIFVDGILDSEDTRPNIKSRSCRKKEEKNRGTYRYYKLAMSMYL